ncbi:hypothetical protein ACU4GR_00585 [Methylobacterium oryzae CBMB20]
MVAQQILKAFEARDHRLAVRRVGLQAVLVGSCFSAQNEGCPPLEARCEDRLEQLAARAAQRDRVSGLLRLELRIDQSISRVA